MTNNSSTHVPCPPKPHPALIALTLALVLAVLFLALGANPLISFNEARRVLPARGMLESGNWLLPQLNGELYLKKPPLLYWLIAELGLFFGEVNEWVGRLPSALAALITLGFVYRYGKLVFGAWGALFAVQILVANAGFAVLARRAEIEMLLAALCTLALLSILHFVREGNRVALMMGYFLMGLAFLTKGPLVLLFVILPLIFHAWRSDTPRVWVALRSAWGWILFAAVGLSWYGLVTADQGWGVWMEIVQIDILDKIQGRRGGTDPLYAYPLWLLGDFFPFILLLLFHPVKTVRGWLSREDTAVLLYAVLIPLLVFSLSGDKHAKYLLPTYPALALLLGQRLEEIYMAGSRILQRAVLGGMFFLLFGYTTYFTLMESRIYAARLESMPQIAALFRAYPNTPAVVIGNVDERVVFYAARPLQSITLEDLPGWLEQNPDSLIFSTEPKPLRKSLPSLCQLGEFSPFLRQGKEAVLLGAGRPCLHASPGK